MPVRKAYFQSVISFSLRQKLSIFAAMSQTHIVIIGTDATARIAIDVFTACNQVVLGILETDPDRVVAELNDVGVFSRLDSEDAKTVMSGDNVEYFVAVGDNASRKASYEAMADISKKPAAQATHPAAVVSPYARTGFGNLINAGTVINANAFIGDQNIIHAHVSIDTDAIIGNYCHINAGVRIGGNATIEDEVFIGTGAVIHPGVKVGAKAVIGAGSVVLREVLPGQIVHGNPAMPV